MASIYETAKRIGAVAIQKVLMKIELEKTHGKVLFADDILKLYELTYYIPPIIGVKHRKNGEAGIFSVGVLDSIRYFYGYQSS